MNNSTVNLFKKANFKYFLFFLIGFFSVGQIFSQGDICSAATTLIPGTSCSYITGNVSGNTVQELTDATCTGTLNDDVYFQFVATEPTMTITVDGSASFDAVFALFGGSCAALVQEGDCVDLTVNGGEETQTFYGLTVGQTYFVLVYDWGAGIPATTTFDICVFEPCPGGVPNDLCSSATTLTLNTTEAASNICASPNNDDPLPVDICATTIENTVWYEFTPTTTDQYSAIISDFNCLYNFGLQMAIITGTCGGPYSMVDCSSGTTSAEFIFTGTAGTTYYIVVDGVDGDQCDFDVLIQDACPADAGTNTSGASLVSCFNEDVNVSTIGAVNTNLGLDPCINWGFWVANDPLGIYTGLTDIGSIPSGGMPTDDNNFVGAYPSLAQPNANGPSATLPAENNGVTYYVAPITMSDCSISEINSGCFDVGDYTEIYFNPEVSYNSIIECDNNTIPTTQITFTFSGGNALVDGTNFTITNNADGSLSTTTPANGATVVLSGIPNGGIVDLVITDAVGCSISLILGPIDAAAYCPSCGADAGNVLVTQSGSGSTISNNGVGNNPYILCYNDNIALETELDYTLPPAFTGSTAGLIYIIYTCPPSSPDPFTDPCYTGVAWTGENLFDTNDGSLLTLLETNFGVTITDNELWFVPTVVDDIDPVLGWNIDSDGDGCFNQGLPIQVTFLDEILSGATATISCGGEVDFVVTGGSPAFYPESYVITNNGPGTLINHIGLASGGSFSLIGLSFGDIYDITISDPNGCSESYTGTYNYVDPVPTFSGLITEFCVNDPTDDFEVYIDGSPALLGLGGTTCTTPTVTASGDDYLNVTATVDLSCAAGYTISSATLDFTSSGVDCPAWSYFDIVVNGNIVATNQCNATGFDLSPYFPLSSVQVISQDNDSWIDPVTITAFVELEYTNSNAVSIDGIGVIDNADGTGSFSPNIVGTQTITGTVNIAGCTYEITEDVTVHPYPVLAALSTVSVCSGSLLDLNANTPSETAGVGGSGQWYTGTDNTGTPVSGLVIVSSGDQFYYEYTSTIGGCTVGGIMDVIVDDFPSVSGSFLSSTIEGCSSADAPAAATTIAALEGLGSPSDPLIINDDVTIDNDLVVTNSDVFIGSCPIILTRTYTITDECGNIATATQTITIDDTTDPLLSEPPADITVECSGDVPAMVDLSWTDNCDGSGAVAGVDGVLNGGSCGGTFTRTWTYTDACGNVATATQTITIDDTTDPTASNPSDINSAVPVSPDISVITDAADNCTPNPIIAFVSDVSDGNICPETITRTYSVTDDCGNQILVTQNILIGEVLVPEPSVVANGPICEGGDAIFTITGVDGATVIYNTGSGSSSVVLTGGSAIITVSGVVSNTTIDLSSIADGSCISSISLSATTVVNALSLSTFTQLGPYCLDDTPGPLLTTSLEGLTGSWTPSVVDASVLGISTYTFTVDIGECAIGTTMDIEVTAPIVPDFAQIDTHCIDVVAPALDVLSTNGISGTWSPSIINTTVAGTSPYTYTPDAGECASVVVVDITIIPEVQSTFDALGPYCVQDPPGALLTTSLESITGSWTPSVIDVFTPGLSTYTFTVDVGQCAIGTTMEIEVTEPIVPDFTQIDPLCINVVAPSLDVLSNNGIFGTWSPSTINTSVAGTITYTFTPDAGVCASVVTMDITITPETPSTFDALGPYCIDETPAILLTNSLEGITGLWAPSVIDVSTPGVTTYAFTVDAGQCAVGTTMDIEVTAPIVPDFTQIDPLCINVVAPSLDVVSNNSISGTWSPSTINTSVVGTITYTFTPDAGECASVVTMDIEVVSTPVIDPGIDQTINCVSNVGGVSIGSATIAGNSYSWSPSIGLSDPSVSDPLANPLINTLYTLTVTNAAGCSSVGTVNVFIDTDPPIIGITNNSGTTTLTCVVLDINLNATGGNTYSWDNGLGISENVIITSPGTYTVTGTGVNGCEAQSSIEITQNNDVDLLVILPINEICSGDDVLVSISSSNATDFNWTVVQDGVAGATTGSGANTSDGLEITQTLTLIGNSQGTVDYTIIPTLGDCIGEAQTITVTVITPEESLFSNLGPYCLGEITTDILNTESDNNISGSWSPPVINTDVVGTTSYVFTPSPGLCATDTTMDILVNDIPNVSFSADTLQGCSPLSVSFSGSSPTGNNTWTFGNGDVLTGNSVSTVFYEPGCYDVTLSIEENGCANVMTLIDYICVQSDPLASFSVSPQSFSDVNQLVSFSNNSIGAVEYFWDFGDGGTSQNLEPAHLYLETEGGILVTLIAISEFGCIDSIQIVIPYDEQEIFYVPNTFTPDGDNFNQIFTPVFYSGYDPYNFQMIIFNRWGEIIFETNNVEKGWDGSYGVGGVKVQDGIYTWKITYKNPETDERKITLGHVTLLR